MTVRLSRLQGQEVFTEEGERVGAIADITLDPTTGKVLTLLIDKLNSGFTEKIGVNGKGLSISFKAVKAVGDIVILSNAIYSAREI